jgi:hypothetical protein
MCALFATLLTRELPMVGLLIPKSGVGFDCFSMYGIALDLCTLKRVSVLDTRGACFARDDTKAYEYKPAYGGGLTGRPRFPSH